MKQKTWNTLLDCIQYGDVRKQYTFMQQPYKENRIEHVADILLFTEANSEQIENRKQYLKKSGVRDTTI